MSRNHAVKAKIQESQFLGCSQNLNVNYFDCFTGNTTIDELVPQLMHCVEVFQQQVTTDIAEEVCCIHNNSSNFNFKILIKIFFKILQSFGNKIKKVFSIYSVPVFQNSLCLLLK